MNKPIINCAAVLLLALGLAACGASTQGPSTWLDRPLDGAKAPLKPLTVQAHASDADGVARFEFFVDNTPLATASSSGGRFADAQVQWSPSVPGTYTVRARAVDTKGNLGSDATSLITVGVPPPEPAGASTPGEPEITFAADRTNLKPGECATLQWSVRGGFGVLLDGQSVNPAGQKQVCPPETATFGLDVDLGTGIGRREVMISVESAAIPPPSPEPSASPVGEPEITFTADRTSLKSGECATLHWSVRSGTPFGVELDSQSVNSSGEKQVCPTETTTYSLGVDLGTFVKRQDVVIAVTSVIPPTPESGAQTGSGCPGAPVISSFAANPSTITAGQSTTLNWGNVTNGNSTQLVRSAVIDPGLGEVGSGASSRVVKPATTTIYTLTGTGCGGTATKQATVVVNSSGPPPPPPPPPPSKDATPPSISNAKANPGLILKQGTGCPAYSRTTTVSATVTDAGGVNRVVARWTLASQSGEVTMTSGGGNVYQASVGPVNTAGTLSIIIVAWDKAGNSSQAGPLTVKVQECLK